VSLYSVHTANLAALGAGGLLVGVQDSPEPPAALAGLPRVSVTGDAERVIALEPDLVLTRPFRLRTVPDFFAKLEQAGIAVAAPFPQDFADFDHYILELAALCGKTQAATAQLAAFHAELDAIRTASAQRSEAPVLFFESTADEVRTVSPDSLPATAIRIAGGINAAANAKPLRPGSPIAPFGTERLVAIADTIDLYIVQQGVMNPTRSLAELQARPGFMAIPAVREGRVLFINEYIISSPTFDYVRGVREIAERVARLR
jgi:iron complex transport system substrate-binding protein